MSDPLEIPVALDTPLFTERVTLDGSEYLLQFDWNGRENRWYLDLSTVGGTYLSRGIKLVCNWPLLRRFAIAGLPKGNLSAVDYSPMGGEPPALADLGRRVKLVYTPL